jgi:hypothetical protein
MTKEHIQDNGAELLSEIIGARLSSVQFVMDYLILGFDAKGGLTTLVWPEIISAEQTIEFGMPGYRDSLCDLIMRLVENVEITPDETIIIGFGRDVRLAIPLRTHQRPGERAIFTTPTNRLFAW